MTACSYSSDFFRRNLTDSSLFVRQYFVYHEKILSGAQLYEKHYDLIEATKGSVHTDCEEWDSYLTIRDVLLEKLLDDPEPIYYADTGNVPQIDIEKLHKEVFKDSVFEDKATGRIVEIAYCFPPEVEDQLIRANALLLQQFVGRIWSATNTEVQKSDIATMLVNMNRRVEKPCEK
jgi:hypothetical protein